MRESGSGTLCYRGTSGGSCIDVVSKKGIQMLNSHCSNARILFALTPMLAACMWASTSVHGKSPQTAQSQMRLVVTDWWNSPFKIRKVLVGDTQVPSDSTLLTTSDWLKQLRVEGMSNTGQTVSYVGYAVDFTLKDRSAPLLRYQFGLGQGLMSTMPNSNGKSLALRTGEAVTISADHSWESMTSIVEMINKRSNEIDKIELFVETVCFDDGTFWLFGTMMKRSPESPDVFLRVKN
jgi:hypothetical protein